MPARLPTPGADDGTWGSILNTYLDVEHNVDGTLKIRSDGTLKSTLSVLNDVNTSGAANGQVLSFDTTSSKWVPATVTGSGSVADASSSVKGIVQLSGDLGGTAASPAVAKVKGVTLPASAPSAGQVLTATSSSASSWSTPSTTDASKLAIANNLSDVANPATARSNLGLGTAATQPTSAFDAAGAATAAQAASLQKSSNLSDLTSAATARTNLGLSTAGGDLSGTLPSPTVAKVNGVAVSGTPTSGQVLTASSSSAASWSTPSSGGTDSTKLAIANNLSDVANPATARTNLGLSTAGGDLSGTLPSPTVAKVNGVAVSGTPSTGQVLTATSTSAATWSTASTTDASKLAITSNLSDLNNITTARSNLGLGTAATQNVGAFDSAGAASAVLAVSLQKSNNLSDITSTTTARSNLGLGSAATISSTAGGDLSGTLPLPTVAKINGVTLPASAPTNGQVLTATSGTATAWSTPSTTDVSKLAIANNLSDLTDTTAARSNLALGTAATISSTAGGDLSGTLPAPTVAKVNGVAVTGTPSTGQVLTATGTTAAAWSTPAAGFTDPTTTKGDVMVHGASTTRLPVGSNGQVLSADSTQATGLKWIAPSGGGSSFLAVAKATSYTASSYDFIVGNAASAGFTVTLPVASNGAIVRVKKMDSSINAIVVTGQSGATIDTGASVSINSQYQSLDFLSDGTNWFLV